MIRNFIVNYWLLLMAACGGAFLRFFQLGEQYITGDEWHALHAAMNSSYWTIASSFGIADHSIPVALYFKWMLENITLTQMTIQLPFVLTGVASIVVVPILIRHYIGISVTNIVALLLAFSPILIIFSRFARPYTIGKSD